MQSISGLHFELAPALVTIIINYLTGTNLMWRLIFLGLSIYLLFTVFKRLSAGSKNDNGNTKKGASVKEPEIENMVQCATCAVHLPRSEAFLVNGDFYCSKSHIPK